MPSRACGLSALGALVVQNTSLVIILKFTFRQGAIPYAASTVVLVTEVVKLLTCYVVYMVSSKNASFLDVLRQLKSQKLLLVPPVLYVVQNNLLFYGAKRLPSVVYMLCSQTKILTTALMSKVILGAEINRKQYLYLLLLIVGIVVVQSLQEGQTANVSVALRGNLWLGMTAVFLASITSATAGVVLEKIFKMSTSSNALIVHTIWSRNIQMSLLSIPFAVIVVYFQDPERLVSGVFFEGYDVVVWFVVALQATGGIITAYVLKFASNIRKCLAIAISICLCAAYSVISGELELTVYLVTGVFLVCTSVGGYSISTTQQPQEKNVDPEK